MDTARGVVIALDEADAQPGRAVVSVAARDVCRRCAEGRGCGAGVFGRGQRDCRLEVAVLPGHRLEVGQAVTLAIDERRLFTASMLAYGLPLAGMGCGAIAARALASADAAGLLGAAFGLLAGWIVARWRLAGSGCIERLTPHIVDPGASR